MPDEKDLKTKPQEKSEPSYKNKMGKKKEERKKIKNKVGKK